MLGLGLGLGLSTSHPAVAEGPNLVTNGTFTDNANGWTLNGGTFHETNYIAFEDTDEASYAQQAISLTEGALYQAKFTISGYSNGTFALNVGGTQGTARTSEGTFTENIVAGASDWIRIGSVAEFPNNAHLDSVELRLLS